MPQLLVSVEGVQVKHLHLSKDRTTLGRKAGNDIVLDNAAVSGQHCVFELRGLADVYVEDLGSTNGTFVNNVKVQRQLLQDEDVVAVAGFRLRYLASSGDSGFGATSVFPHGAAQMAPASNALFRVLTGSSAGLEVPVVKAVSTFGKPGIAVIAVSHRRNGYFAAQLTGEQPALLNGLPLGDEPVQLAHEDVIQIGGTAMRFLLEG